MSYRNGTSGGNLFFEVGYYTAIWAQYIAKTGGNKLRGSFSIL